MFCAYYSTVFPLAQGVQFWMELGGIWQGSENPNIIFVYNKIYSCFEIISFGGMRAGFLLQCCISPCNLRAKTQDEKCRVFRGVCSVYGINNIFLRAKKFMEFCKFI